MAEVQLALKDVSLTFGSSTLLKNVTLEIARGESVVFIGPSGHGKTCALKLLAGLIPPTRGQVMIAGEDFARAGYARQSALRLNMGMLFQKNALFDSLTAGENIAFPLREKSDVDAHAIESKVTHFLDAVGLSEARDRYPADLSGGMQKRLGIARALALSPEIVFYDDPTAGLDPITSRKIIDLILALRRERGSTLVTVTNDMARAFQLADRIVMVTDGELIVTGSREQTRAHRDPRVANFIRGRASA